MTKEQKVVEVSIGVNLMRGIKLIKSVSVFSLVELVPEVGADQHDTDHAEVDQREDNVFKLLVDDVVEDAINFPQVKSIGDVLLLFLPITLPHFLL